MMRYRFVDRVVGFTPPPNPTLTIEKAFPAGEDCFTGPIPDAVPVSLLIETLAMAGGHLILRALAPDRLPLLLKVEEASVLGRVLPGETVLARVALRGTGKSEEPAMVVQTEGELTVDGRPVLSGRVLYACVRMPGLFSEARSAPLPMPPPEVAPATPVLERPRSSARL